MMSMRETVHEVMIDVAQHHVRLHEMLRRLVGCPDVVSARVFVPDAAGGGLRLFAAYPESSASREQTRIGPEALALRRATFADGEALRVPVAVTPPLGVAVVPVRQRERELGVLLLTCELPSQEKEKEILSLLTALGVVLGLCWPRICGKSSDDTQKLATLVRTDRLRALGEMAGGMAHEFNQPLTGIRGFAEHILICRQRGWALTDNELDQRLQNIISLVDRMAKLIEHVRNFSHEADCRDVSDVDPRLVVEAALRLTSAQLRNHGIEVKFSPGQTPALVRVNPFVLEEMVLHVVNNARDALDALPSAERERSLRIELCADGGMVQLLFTDNGTGIDDAIRHRVFDPFFTTKGPKGGQGMGLSIVRNLCDLYGGSVEIVPSAPRGESVRISLPVVEAMNLQPQGILSSGCAGDGRK